MFHILMEKEFTQRHLMTQEEYNALNTDEKIELSKQENLSEETVKMLINDDDMQVKLQLMMNSEVIAKKMFQSFES